jgi:hypothetical protein
VLVNRGPSLASCSAAIAAAAIADATAKEKREEAAERRREEAFRAVQRYPLRVALADAQNVAPRPCE